MESDTVISYAGGKQRHFQIEDFQTLEKDAHSMSIRVFGNHHAIQEEI